MVGGRLSVSKTVSNDFGDWWLMVMEIRTRLGNWPWPAMLESQTVEVVAVPLVPPVVEAEPLVLVVLLAAVPLLVVLVVLPPAEAVPVSVVPLEKYSNFRSVTSGASMSIAGSVSSTWAICVV